MSSIPLFLSHEHPCSYLDGQTAQSAFVHPSFPLTSATYSLLLERGFRRSGKHVYSPHCSLCSACIAVRIPVTTFKPSRAQKRALKKNQATTVHIKPAVFDPKHYQLYLKYQQTRHQTSNMAQSTTDEYISFLSSEWCDSLFVEFIIDQHLVAVAIVDQLSNALSAVYTFFDPDYATYSLGVYAVLWQIQRAQQQQLKWLYLGFWIEDCRKMSYKTQYRPLQMFINGRWSEADRV